MSDQGVISNELDGVIDGVQTIKTVKIFSYLRDLLAFKPTLKSLGFVLYFQNLSQGQVFETNSVAFTKTEVALNHHEVTFRMSLYLFSLDSFFLISPNLLITKSTELVEREEQIPMSRLPFKVLTLIFHWNPTGDSVLMEEVR